MTSRDSILAALRRGTKINRPKITRYTPNNCPWTNSELNIATSSAINHFGSKEEMMKEVAKESGVPLSNGKMTMCRENLAVFIKWGVLPPEKTAKKGKEIVDFLNMISDSQTKKE